MYVPFGLLIKKREGRKIQIYGFTVTTVTRDAVRSAKVNVSRPDRTQVRNATKLMNGQTGW